MNPRYLTDPDNPEDAAEVEQMLAEQLPATMPPPAMVAELRNRMLARVRAAGLAEEDMLRTRLAEGDWRPLVRGVRAKILAPEQHAVLLELAPGSHLPVHRHHEDEECVVLRGAVRMRDIRVGTGDYHLARLDSRHAAVHSDDGALLYLCGTPIGDTRETLRSLVTALIPGRGAAPVTLRAGEGEWLAVGPGVEARVLHQGDVRQSCMLRFAPGAALRGGRYSIDREFLVVQGEVYHGREVATSGDYQLARAGRACPEMASDAGATVFVRGAPLT